MDRSEKTRENKKSIKPLMKEEEIAKIENLIDIHKLNGWNENSFVNHLSIGQSRHEKEIREMYRKRETPDLTIGMGCTIKLYSDRRAATIIRIVSPKEIVIRYNKTKCVDYYASEYEILDEFEEVFEEETYTLRKGGTWVQKGQPKKNGSVTLTVGFRHHYIDPSF